MKLIGAPRSGERIEEEQPGAIAFRINVQIEKAIVDHGCLEKGPPRTGVDLIVVRRTRRIFNELINRLERRSGAGD